MNVTAVTPNEFVYGAAASVAVFIAGVSIVLLGLGILKEIVS